MTETEKKALALVNEACKSDFKDLGITYRNNILDALLLAIEQHEAFRQEVSDAVESRWMNILAMKCEDVFSRFILAKPDPLVEAWDEAWGELNDKSAKLETFRAALAARGLEVRKIGESE